MFWKTSTHHTGSDPVNKLGDEANEFVLVSATPAGSLGERKPLSADGQSHLSEWPPFIRVAPLIPYRGSIHSQLCRVLMSIILLVRLYSQ